MKILGGLVEKKVTLFQGHLFKNNIEFSGTRELYNISERDIPGNFIDCRMRKLKNDV